MRPERGRSLRGLALALGLATLAAGPAAGDAERVEEARATAERTLGKVVDILQADELSLEERRERVKDIAYDRFDFRTISRLVVGRPWRSFSPEQRERFSADFQRLLSESYGNRIGRYEGGEVEVVGARSEARGDVTVRTRIRGGEAEGIKIDYRLRENDDGAWRVIDVVAEGVSLVSSYRSQFAPILSRGGPEELMKRLEEKIAEADSGEEADPLAEAIESG